MSPSNSPDGKSNFQRYGELDRADFVGVEKESFLRYGRVR